MTHSASRLAFDADLIRKYDQFGPRYTSYPTADRFHRRLRPGRLRERARHPQPRAPRRPAVGVRAPAVLQHALLLLRLQQGRHARPRPQRPSISSYLAGEIAHRGGAARGTAAPVVQLHLGGGTPTFLARDEMADLMAHLRRASRSRRTPRSRSKSIRARSTPGPMAFLARARLQPHVGRRAGLRPGRAEGGEPRSRARTRRARDRRGARERLRLGQPRPDLRPAAADARELQGDARQGDRRLARPHRALQLRAPAAAVQAAAPHPRCRAAVAGDQARDPHARDRAA